MRKYFIAKNNSTVSSLDSYFPYGSILGWDSFSLDQKHADYLLSINYKINEVDKDIAIFGVRGFGDIRSEIKIGYTDVDENIEFDGSQSTENYISNSPKIKISVSEKRYSTVVKTMKLLSKLIIEDVFEQKFIALDYNVSSLEKECWKYQINNDEQFIESIASVKGLDVNDLKEAIEISKEIYESKTKNLYLKMIELKQKFYVCDTIKELNVLFEDYMGLPMPMKQAVEEGRYIDVEGIDIPVRQEVIPGFKF